MTDDASPDDLFRYDDPTHPPYAPDNDDRFDTLRQELWHRARWGIPMCCAEVLLLLGYMRTRPFTGTLTDRLFAAVLLATLAGIILFFTVKLVHPHTLGHDVTALAARLRGKRFDREAPDSDTTDAQRE